MYTYEQIKEVLMSQISQLLEIEPKWEKCSKCPNSGACCIGADITMYEYEWEIISKYLIDNPIVFNEVKLNYRRGLLCYFRTDDKCLIHDIRPLNCIFTPYQAIFGADRCIHYAPYKEDCSLLKPTSISNNGMDLSQLFIRLPDDYTSTCYLLLNHWYQDYEGKSLVCDSEVKLSDALGCFLAQY